MAIILRHDLYNSLLKVTKFGEDQLNSFGIFSKILPEAAFIKHFNYDKTVVSNNQMIMVYWLQ